MNAPTRVAPRSPYLVGPAYDWAFFLLPPLVSLVVGALVAESEALRNTVRIGHVRETLASFALGVIVHAHLVAVLFRSHANPAIFRRHPVRFVVVPLVLFAVLAKSTWATAASFVVATAWDVWHSGAQTFGFARIYESRAGAPDSMRRFDFALQQLLYAGPILAGVSLAAHITELHAFGELDDPLARVLTTVPARVLANHRYVTLAVLFLGGLFLLAYVAAHLRMRRRGHPVSGLKVFLVASTGACSIVTWAFDPSGEAFLIMNLFHAVQYLALVWATERDVLVRRLRLPATRVGRSLAFLLFFGAVFAYGISVEALDPEWHLAWAATMVVSLMHFWYDGFVWSVRGGQV